MVKYIDGDFFNHEDLKLLSAFLVDQGQSFDLMLVDKNKFKIDKQAVGIVVSGTGVISNFRDSVLDVNDLILLNPGNYSFSDDMKMLIISGPNLSGSPKIIKQADFPILPSTLGGTRRLLKDDDGKFNIDVHTIWVDEKNIKIPHYHKRLFELYLAIQGQGEILLKGVSDKDFTASPKLLPGGFVLVTPNTIHKAQGKNLVIQVVGIPVFYRDDSFKENL